MDDLAKLRAAIAKQNAERLRKLVDRQKRQNRLTPTTFYLGQDDDGRSLTKSAGGGIVPMQTIGNVQPSMGVAGRGASGGFDAGSWTLPKGSKPRTPTGDVKVCIRILLDTSDEFWLGGDRASPYKILDVPKVANQFIRDTSFESTGTGKNDWIFSIRETRQTPSDPFPLSRVRVIQGDGQQWDTGFSAKHEYLIYYGAGFWASSVIEPAVGVIEADPVEVTTGNFLDLTFGRLTGSAPPGSMFSFVEWDIEVTYLADPSATNRTITTTQGYGGLEFSPPASSSLFGWGAAGNFSGLQVSTTAWEVAPPGPDAGAPLPGGNTPCSGDGPSVDFTQGKKVRLESDNRTTTLTYNLFGLAFYQGDLIENVGSSSESEIQEFSSAEEFWQGTSKKVSAVCVSFDNGNYFVLSSTPLPAGGSYSYSIYERFARDLNGTAPVFVAPNVSKTTIDIESQDFIYSGDENGGNETVLESYSATYFTPLKVFNKGNSYLYVRTVDNNASTTNSVFMKLEGGEESSIIPNGGYNVYSWVVRDNSLALYQTSAAILFSMQWLTTKTYIDVSRFTRSGSTYVEETQFSRGVILPFKLAQATSSNTLVVGGYWWPKG
jgi:hypothetical protein